MTYKPTFVALTLAATGLLALGGCPSFDSRLTNQGGGNIVSAGLKIAQGRMTALTADEVQSLADKVFEKKPELGDYELSDEEAAAAVEFLVVNGINNIDDVQALLEEASTNPDAIEIPDSVATLVDVPDVLDDSGAGGSDNPNTVTSQAVP